MNDPKFFADLKLLLEHIHYEPDKAVKRWSAVECADSQVPLALIAGLLFNALIPNRPVRLGLRDKPEFKAVAEIVENSNLRSLLVVDRSDNCIRFRDGTPDSIVLEVAHCVSDNTTGIV